MGLLDGSERLDRGERPVLSASYANTAAAAECSAGASTGSERGGQEQAADNERPTARDLVSHARILRTGIGSALAAPPARRAVARHAFEAVRDHIVRRELASIPIERLRETTQGRVRLGPIEDAGCRTVGMALSAGTYGLQQIPGVGTQIALKVVAAARQLEMAVAQSARVRIDADNRPDAHTRLLGALRAYGLAESAVAPLRDSLGGLAAQLDAVTDDAARASSRLKMFFSGRRKRETARSSLRQLDELLGSPQAVRDEAELTSALSVSVNRRPSLWSSGWITRSGRSPTTGCLSKSASSPPTSTPPRALCPPKSPRPCVARASTSRSSRHRCAATRLWRKVCAHPATGDPG